VRILVVVEEQSLDNFRCFVGCTNSHKLARACRHCI